MTRGDEPNCGSIDTPRRNGFDRIGRSISPAKDCRSNALDSVTVLCRHVGSLLATGRAAVESNDVATHTSPSCSLRRDWSSFRPESDMYPPPGSSRLRNSLQARRPRRRRDSGARHAPGRPAATADRTGRRSGVGRNGRAPARGPARHGGRQRARRAQPPRSADHGRQLGALGLPDSGRGREGPRRAAQDDPDPSSDPDSAGRQAHRALSRPIASGSATRSASTTRSSVTSRRRWTWTSRRSWTRSRRRGRSGS